MLEIVYVIHVPKLDTGERSANPNVFQSLNQPNSSIAAMPYLVGTATAITDREDATFTQCYIK